MADIEYFPQSLLGLQKELLDPYHKGLYVKLQLTYGEEAGEGDLMDFMLKLATVADIKIDGDYTAESLAEILLNRIRKQRLADTITDLSRGLQ